jgi:putative hydrolase of the HAD superfamily
MVIIFDLDDTLYNEKDFVFSGFSEVANWISNESKNSFDEIFHAMFNDFNSNGRGHVFDNILEKYHKKTKKNIRKCISIYRLHTPKISLSHETRKLLLKLKKKYKLYVVTDGNKIVQKNKTQSLNLNTYFEKIFITYRYGIKSSKPSLKCFEIIKNIEKTNWEKIVYIGDNPHKDFVNLNKMKAITIRILYGDYANDNVDKKFDAKYKIYNLTELYDLLKTNL